MSERKPMPQPLKRCAFILLAAALIALAAPAALAQQSAAVSPTAATKPLTFEAATIKPNNKNDGRWKLQPTPDGYTAMGVSLFKLVQEAYGIFDAKLITGGPPWIDRDKFDLEAKFDVNDIPDAKKLPYRQRADMLQSLLTDRFHLKVHHETKEFPVYNLVIAKGNPKLQETKPANVDGMGTGVTCHVLKQRGGYTQRQDCTVTSLEDLLRYATGRTVLDKTGLTGHYDFELRWTPDDTPADSPNASGPSIFTAVQEQLGLKLEPSTAPLDTLVIDHAEPPTAN
jgi:uncharacterized protein (TIGR03435 family)